MRVFVLSHDFGFRYADNERLGTYHWVPVDQVQHPQGVYEIPEHKKDQIIEFQLTGELTPTLFKYLNNGLYRELSKKEKDAYTRARQITDSSIQSYLMARQGDQKDS